MNPLFDVFIRNGLLLDVFGVLGLGLIGLAAVRLSHRDRSWGGTFMAIGAISLLTARLFILSRPAFAEMGLIFTGTTASLAVILPSVFLTIGLAGIVWGIWAHERWLKETR